MKKAKDSVGGTTFLGERQSRWLGTSEEARQQSANGGQQWRQAACTIQAVKGQTCVGFTARKLGVVFTLKQGASGKMLGTRVKEGVNIFQDSSRGKSFVKHMQQKKTTTECESGLL
eukprot:959242-Pelagomonas_calceolata.AAC.7